MITAGTRFLAAAAAFALLPSAGGAGETELRQAVEDLTERVRELEAAQRPDGRRHEWLPGVRLSGNADFDYINGEGHSIAADGRFAVQNARIYLDIDLGWDAQLYGRPLLESSSFYVEWDIARYGRLLNDIGALYARFDGLLGSRWLNARIGRVAIPYGEEYVRWYEERPSNPLLDFSAGSPYNWDEGVLFSGSDAEGRFGYVVSLMDGDDGFSVNHSADVAVAGRLFARPTPWSKISVSGLHTGSLGAPGDPARSAFKFGWSQAVPFGSGTGVPSFQDGAPIGPDPSPVIDSLDGWEGDVIFSHPGLGRLWLGFGQLFIDSGGSSLYDRDLLYWIAEAIFELGVLSPVLDPFYLAARYSEIGSFDSDRGYRLIALNDGWDLGFNTERVTVVGTGVGMRLTDSVTLKAQYTWVEFDVVRGVTDAIRSDAEARDWFGVGVSLGF